MRPRHLVLLLLNAALWGASFLFIRLGSPALGPLAFVAARMLLAAITLVVYLALLGRLRTIGGHLVDWRRFLLLGAINSAIPSVLIATAELHLTASLAALLNTTMPLFTLVFAALAGVDRLTPMRLVGVALGCVGVGVLVGWSPVPLGGVLIFSIGLSLLASCCYGLGSVFSKVAFRGTPALALALGQQVGASLVSLPFAVIWRPSSPPTLPVALAVVGAGVACTAVAYVIYFTLIREVGPTSTNTVTLLVPVFGVLWARIFLHEAVAPGMVVGLVIILASVALITSGRGLRSQGASAPKTNGVRVVTSIAEGASDASRLPKIYTD